MLLLHLLALVFGGVCGEEVSDEVLSLPGWSGPLPSRHFSGYINASPTKRLHYYLVESENDPSNDPVAVWFNGGPGCSSLDGFLYEHGPFRFAEGSVSLERFEYTWAKLANMVYIEQPVGVGFSYSTEREYACTDDTAAADNLAALTSFFEKYPTLRDRELFIFGESYAGIYVPTLAEAILKSQNTSLNLAGIAVGNGCSGNEIGICAFDSSTQGSYYVTKYLAQQPFIPDALKRKLYDVCDWATWSQGGPITPNCTEAVLQLDALTQNLDTYCVNCDCGEQFPASSKSPREQLVRAPTLKQRVLLHAKDDEDDDDNPTTACIDSVKASAWLNQPSVRRALHVTAANVSDWSVCGTPDDWTYESTRPNLPRDTYPLLVSNIRVLIYNGDWDACVPYTDNEAWTSSMGYNESKPWHPWTHTTSNGYTGIGGYATQFDVPGGGAFTFTTVRGGRHEVPETAPERAFAMIQKFIKGEDL